MPLFKASPVKGESSSKAVKPAERLSPDPSTSDTDVGRICPGVGVSFGSAEAVMPRASDSRSTIAVYRKCITRLLRRGVRPSEF